MAKNVETIVDAWFEKNNNNSIKYSKEKITEIATNCVSLSEAWLDRVKNIKDISFELDLYNKEGVLSETLHGVSRDNVAETLLDTLVNGNSRYSKAELNYFKFEDGRKATASIGEIEIS